LATSQPFDEVKRLSLIHPKDQFNSVFTGTLKKKFETVAALKMRIFSTKTDNRQFCAQSELVGW